MSGDARRVLLVEDDRDLALAVENILVDEGFAVEKRFDGESGLAAGLEADYDLIILDIMLPKRNGFTVCQELRGAGVQTPLLMLTAKDGELDEVEGLEVGADDFLRKPFERSVLVARLHALLRRHDRDTSQTLTVGPVTIDLIRRSVLVDDQAVTLTPREFRLLEHLLRHSPTPVSKPDLLSAVWGEDFDGDPNIVEVYIGYLRRKLDVGGSPSIIRTLRGLGYCAAAV
jgi:two-component system, OmpR family, response regulator